MITAIVDQKKPAHGEKGQYCYVRQAEEKTRRTRRKRTKPVGESLHADHAEGQITGSMDCSANTTVPIIMFTSDQLSGEPRASTHARQSPDEEEMADDEESEEWRIRVGNQSPPQWGKRKANDEGDNEPHAPKKTRVMWVFSRGVTHQDSRTLQGFELTFRYLRGTNRIRTRRWTGSGRAPLHRSSDL